MTSHPSDACDGCDASSILYAPRARIERKLEMPSQPSQASLPTLDAGALEARPAQRWRRA